jgi:hypothetical protein
MGPYVRSGRANTEGKVARMIRLVVGHGRYARQVSVPGWMLALMGAGAMLAFVLLLTFPAGLALLAIPACLIGAAAARWLGQPRGGAREPIFTRHRSADAKVIDGEYRVLTERDSR